MNEFKTTEKAIREAKKMKKMIARRLVDHLPQEESAVSVFMAGSPGAGKTETARNMMKSFKKEYGVKLVHIENDELRKEFEDYNGINSPLFQRPATLLVEVYMIELLKKVLVLFLILHFLVLKKLKIILSDL